jgi:hypothetical protein
LQFSEPYFKQLLTHLKFHRNCVKNNNYNIRFIETHVNFYFISTIISVIADILILFLFYYFLLNKKTRIKLYNTLTLPVLLHGSETWTIKARATRRITTAEMKYMRRTAG